MIAVCSLLGQIEPVGPPDGNRPPIRGVIIFIGLVAALIWAIARTRHDFVITAKRGRVHFRGNFPGPRRPEVESFFAAHPNAPVTIRGRWRPNRHVELTITGRASQADKQRIRNFIRMALGII